MIRLRREQLSFLISGAKLFARLLYIIILYVNYINIYLGCKGIITVGNNPVHSYIFSWKNASCAVVCNDINNPYGHESMRVGVMHASLEHLTFDPIVMAVYRVDYYVHTCII